MGKVNIKRIILPLLVCSVFTSFVSPVVAEQTYISAGYLGYYLYFDVKCPSEAKVGDDITVKLTFIADADIESVEIYVSIYGAGISYDKSWVDVNMYTGQTLLDTATLTPTSEGNVTCYIDGQYFDPAYGDWDAGAALFQIAYARNVPYDELSNDYENLNSTYYRLLSDYGDLNSTYDNYKENHRYTNSEYNELNENYSFLSSNYSMLQSNYTSLQSDIGDLQNDYSELNSKYSQLTNEMGTIRNLMYVFVATTIVFIATTIFLVLRKPKVKPIEKI